MRVVILSRNSFSGPLSNLCEMISVNNFLGYLDLSDNLLSGPIPDCWNYGKDLEVLNLARNNLSVKIPDSIGYLVQLKMLIFENNGLYGEIPPSLKSCTSLLVIDLGLNKLSGAIPEWIGENLLDLRILVLNSNALEGLIPLQLCQLKALKLLNLASNRLSGRIPSCVGTLQALTEPGSSCYYNYDLKTLSMMHLERNITGAQRLFPQAVPVVKSMDLSSNNLSGEIPSQFTSLGGLLALNLSRNSLTGTIPPNIGAMEAMESLDLSWNELSCAIPDSILSLSNLSHLNLSHNKLSGPIPHGKNLLSKFGATSYLENQNLCGPPLSKNCLERESYGAPDCPKMELQERSRSSEEETGNGMGIPPFYISMALGFIIGFWGFWTPLLLNTSWRHAYFKFLGSMIDEIYVRVVVGVAKLQRKLQSQRQGE
ncbi:receptor-like protein EIX1 [Hevea brasiliensis]|nr:receptor-like protein EIX1 [Hevea brasiliensis]